MIVTDPSSLLATTAFLACGSIAMPAGFFPTLIDVFTAVDVSSITDTVSSPEFVTQTSLPT